MNLLEIHSQKTDNGIASRYGFGCGDYNPGNGSSRYRGLLFHESIVRDPLTNVNKKSIDIRYGVT